MFYNCNIYVYIFTTLLRCTKRDIIQKIKWPKKSKNLIKRSFQETFTNEYGFIQQKDRAVCALCCESVVCRTSSVLRHYETKQEYKFKISEEKSEAIKRVISGFKEQTGILNQSVAMKNKGN